MTDERQISRRAALARLGLGAAAAYVAPSVAGLSYARASSEPSSPSTSSSPSQPSPSQSSTPSAPDPDPSQELGASATSGPSSAGGCKLPSELEKTQISESEYRRAQAAISRGDARPLGEILRNVRNEYPGKAVKVGFSRWSLNPVFRVQIVSLDGAVLSVTVDAGTGRVISARKC